MTAETWALLQEQLDVPEVYGGPATEAEITAAEQAIGVIFSPAYRQFLLRYGSAQMRYPIYGVRAAADLGRAWSVQAETEHFRKDGWPGTERWAVISMDRFGNPVGLNSEGRILKWDHDTHELVQMAPDFETFLLDFSLCW